MSQHAYLFTQKEINALRPAERFAYDNAQGYELRVFLGSGRWAKPVRFERLEDAGAEYDRIKAQGGRPMIYAFAADAQGRDNMCHIAWRKKC